MPTARREHFGSLLEPGLANIFYETYNQVPTMRQELFNVQTTDNPWEKDLSIGTLGDFPEFKGVVEYDTPYEGYGKLYEFPEFAKGFRIERKLFDDDRYNVINQRPVSLALRAARRQERDAASLFNNAFNAAFPGPDGVPLCHAQHPSGAYEATNGAEGIQYRSNLGSAALSHAALQAAKNAMRRFQDDRGDLISVVPDTLLVPVALEEVAWELIQSEKKVDTNENNPNIHYGKYKLIVWDELNDETPYGHPWFLIDSKYAKLFLKWYDRVPLEFAMEEDFDTLVAKYRAYMRYGFGWSDWVWVYGSPGGPME